MKKRFAGVIAAGLVIALGAGALYGCGDSKKDEQAAGDPNGAAATKTLVVGFDAAYPPYGALADKGQEGYKADDGNTYYGFDLDLANEVCKRNDWTLKVQPIDWDSKDAQLESGVINCIWNGFTMEGREGKYTFSNPYMLNSQVVVVKAGSDIKTTDDLKGKNVITQADSAALDLFGDEGEYKDLGATFAGGAIQTIAEYNSAFMQLEAGAVDAVVCDLSVAKTQMNAKPDKYVMFEKSLSDEHYVVGFKLGDEETATIVNDTLAAMDKEGVVKKIAAKYGADIDYDNLWCLGK